MKLFLNIIKFVVIILILIIFMLYIGLNIYVKSKEEKVNQQNLLYLTTVLLNEGQMAIASYIINKKREYEFTNYFFLIHDAFTSNNKISLVAASTYLNDFKKQLSINRNIMELATKRYIMKKINSKICYNYVFSRLYFGNGKYGLIDAAKCYYNKKYSELSEKEFISLCLLLTNPVIYDFTNEEIKQYSEEKVNQIYKKLKKTHNTRFNLTNGTMPVCRLSEC